MSTIKTSFEWIKKFFPYITFILLILMTFLFFNSQNTLRQERKDRKFDEMVNNQNLNAFKDSLSVEFDKKLKAYVWDKENYLVNEIKELKEYNKDLYQKLNKVQGEVIAAIDTKVTGTITDISADNELVTIDLNKGLYGLKFETKYKDSGFENEVDGISKFYAKKEFDKFEQTHKWILMPDTTVLNKIITKINITYGFRELDDKYEVFAVSPSPKIIINEMNGVLVLDKYPKKPVPPKRWGFGPYIGAGLNNFSDPSFGFSVGVALTYDIVQWRMPWEKKK